MLKRFLNLRHSLVSKLIIIVGLVLIFSISTWSYFNINYQERKFMANIIAETDRLTSTIRLGTHYAMMLNSRDDINQIITNIGKLPEIESIRIYNKTGEITFSNHPVEVDQTTNIKAEACDICHRTDPPLVDIVLKERTRIYDSNRDYRLLGIITPIRNEPGCSTGECHFHPEGKKILGALDVVVSLKEIDKEIANVQKGIVGLSTFVCLITSAIIFVFLLRFVNRPIKRLIRGTHSFAKGDYTAKVNISQDDEMGQLGNAINLMGEEINKHQAELNKQRDEYQKLFERVPCLITVQDKEYRILRFNKEFEEIFGAKTGEYCYRAYKGRNKKCHNCPVEKTFKDGMSHTTEESGIKKDGSPVHWLVRTTPIRNESGDIIAAMEINLDITDRKDLENELEKSEKKYHAFFSNIPNPVFVLDKENLKILECNESVKTVYGYEVEDVLYHSFLELFMKEEKAQFAKKIHSSTVLNQVKHVGKDGRTLFVNIRISPTEYLERHVYLVTTSDITKRLEAEQQLIQASKMATLGEMATGVAHELNQPLSVIKTVSSFSMKKINRNEQIDDEILSTMLKKVDKNVDRATNIINHMRQFARKSELEITNIPINDVLKSAFEIFSQQLKVRGIQVVWEIQDDLPLIKVDPARLEQVFINLLLNARDAIEEKRESDHFNTESHRITLLTRTDGGDVVCSVCDTGIGVPPTLENKIFEPFFTTKEVGKGTGLGLSISYGIVNDCGGSIETYPNRKEGTCFVVRFPIMGNKNGSPVNE